MHAFTDVNKITPAITTANGAAGTSAITGATLDMAGFDEVTAVIAFGPIVSGAATSIKAQGGDASDMSDAVDLLGSSQTIADTDDNKVFYIRITKPKHRYFRIIVSRATQAATVGSALYFQGLPSSVTVTQDTNVSGENFISPIAGTA